MQYSRDHPCMVLLSVSVGSSVSPPFCNGRIPSILAIFGSVYGIPVMVLPLFMSIAMSLSSSLDNVQKICKNADSSLNFIFGFLRGYQTLTVSTVTCPFFGMLDGNWTLSCSDCFTEFVQYSSMFAHLF